MVHQLESHPTTSYHRSAHPDQPDQIDSAHPPMTHFIWEIEHQAVVTQTIAPGRPGQVQFQGSWWTARCEQPITLLPHQIVYVVARRNLTLLVRPEFVSAERRDVISA